MLLLVDRRRVALLDGSPPEPSPTLTDEDRGVGRGANVVEVEEETSDVFDEGVELVLSWSSRVKQGGVPLRSRMRSTTSETWPNKMAEQTLASVIPENAFRVMIHEHVEVLQTRC